jgi:hypothetical protein
MVGGETAIITTSTVYKKTCGNKYETHKTGGHICRMAGSSTPRKIL